MTKTGARILLVHPAREAAEILAGNLRSHGFGVTIAEDDGSALQLVRRSHFDLVLLELARGIPWALSAIPKLREAWRSHPPSSEPSLEDELVILVMSAPEDSAMICQAVKAGAVDWVSKPVNIEKLVAMISSLISRRGLLVQPTSMETGLREEPGFVKIIGFSSTIKDVFESIKLVMASDVPVLLLGETGTGKELVAKAIHYRGARRRFPFVTVNCAAIPDSLVESELFGHEGGAFTGAERQRIGRFEEAHMGTIFLDEICEMPSHVQAKMLRAIEEKCFERLGGSEKIRVDVRVISATNRDIQKEVRTGALRGDLYYRLAVFPIRLPALRERKSDIPELANYFLERAMARAGRRSLSISGEAMNRLMHYRWPGNVRQLQNCIGRAVLTAKEDVIRATDIEFGEAEPGEEPLTPSADINYLISTLQRGEIIPLEAVERILIEHAMHKANRHVSEAADLLGISRSTIYRKCPELRRDATEPSSRANR
jgi:DNA-binding NtrC family response regulator